MTSDETTRSTTVGLIENIIQELDDAERYPLSDRRPGYLRRCKDALKHCRDELTKQSERVRELEAKIAALEAAIDAGGLDISPCLDCGTPVVTIPDGMTICDKCVEGDQ